MKPLSGLIQTVSCGKENRGIFWFLIHNNKTTAKSIVNNIENMDLTTFLYFVIMDLTFIYIYVYF